MRFSPKPGLPPQLLGLNAMIIRRAKTPDLIVEDRRSVHVRSENLETGQMKSTSFSVVILRERAAKQMRDAGISSFVCVLNTCILSELLRLFLYDRNYWPLSTEW